MSQEGAGGKAREAEGAASETLGHRQEAANSGGQRWTEAGSSRKRQIHGLPKVQDNIATVPPKSQKQKSTYVKEMLIPPDISVILKEPEDLSQDYNEEENFDPPFHSTAVYAEGEEPLEKEELAKEKPLKQQLLITSWSQQKSKNIATSRSESGEVVRNSTVQNMIIQKTPKTTNKAKSMLDAELSHDVVSPSIKTPQIPHKENRQGKHAKKSLISQKASSKVKGCAPTSGKKTNKAALSSRPTLKVKSKRRKSIQSQTSKKMQSLLKEASRLHTPVSQNNEAKEQAPYKETLHRRASNKNVTSNNAGDEDEASGSEAENSQTPPKSNKIKRKPSDSLETPKKGQDKSPERKRKKLNINDVHTTDANKALSRKVWSSAEVPRSSRDMNELDVVLFECEKVYEDYRETVDSNVDIKAIDLFFACFKEQLTTTIEDAQKLKNLKKKNGKIQLEIGRKRKRLIELKGEVIENESKLKQLQKTYEELQEKQSALKKAKQFISGLGELQKDYLKYREENPEAEETYGMSCLPALLLQSQTIMNAEKHLHDINTAMQGIIGEEEDVC